MSGIILAQKQSDSTIVPVLCNDKGELLTTADVNVSGVEVIVKEDPIVTYEHKNISVPAASSSGTTANPASISDYCVLINESSDNIRIAFDANATSTSGLLIRASSGYELTDALFTTLKIYNTSATTAAAVSIIFGRVA